MEKWSQRTVSMTQCLNVFTLQIKPALDIKMWFLSFKCACICFVPQCSCLSVFSVFQSLPGYWLHIQRPMPSWSNKEKRTLMDLVKQRGTDKVCEPGEAAWYVCSRYSSVVECSVVKQRGTDKVREPGEAA
eukprot:1148325-Pelagomonas_calceolata.AAC.3